MFHNMEYVYAVYKEHSFCKAAERLHISQPSLSASIQKAEKAAGAPIFERKTRPVSLTPFGVEYIQCIEQIQEIQERLRGMACDLRTLRGGHLAIGGSNLDIPYIVPRKIAAFKRAYPQVNLRIVEDSTLGCKALLDSGELDLILTNRPLSTDLYCRQTVYREALVLAVPKELPVNAALEGFQLREDELENGVFSVPPERCVLPSVLDGMPMILLHDGNYLRQCTDAILREGGVLPDVVQEVEKSAVAYTFASLGMGATIVSSVLLQSFPGESLCLYKLGGPHALRDAYVCYRRGRYVTAAMGRFIEMLTETGEPRS